jgi:DNA-directed RNA polymerase II subunit RPB3
MNPIIQIESLTETTIKFRMQHVSLAYANALRRIMISEVPTMAVEFVTIRENTTPLHDEFLAHRLGMIPLYSNAVENFNYPAECACQDNSVICSVCSVKFTLKVKNTGEDVMDVTTAHLKFEAISDNQKSVKPVKYAITKNGENVEREVLIMKLGKNQELDLDCVAKKGQGKQHAKWSPVCVAAFKFEPKISISQVKMLDLTTSQKVAFVNCCPKKVYSFNEKNKTIEIPKPEDCVFCGECERIQKDFNIEDLVKVEEGDFIFDVETNGSLKPDEILDSAFDQMQKKLGNLKEALNGINISVR